MIKSIIYCTISTIFVKLAVLEVAKMYVLGLTGGICSGKSSVGRFLSSKYSVEVIDADKLGHAVYEPNTSCFNKLVEVFGTGILSSDGQINRKELGSIVFSDKCKMNDLQAIVWPEIRTKIAEILAMRKANNVNIVVVEAAVMIEAGWQDLVTSLWVVVVPPELARERLMVRNQLTYEQAQQRLEAQLSNDERKAHANVVLENIGSLEDLEANVSKLFEDVRKQLH